MSARRRPGGYLLLEAVIGIAISALVIGAIWGATREREEMIPRRHASAALVAALASALELAPSRPANRWGDGRWCEQDATRGPGGIVTEWCFDLVDGKRTLEVSVTDPRSGQRRAERLEVMP